MAERKKGEHHNNHNQYTFKKRVCNSDDEATGGDTATCIKPEFPYKEVRIATADHDGSIIVSVCFFLPHASAVAISSSKSEVVPSFGLLQTNYTSAKFHLLLNRLFANFTIALDRLFANFTIAL